MTRREFEYEDGRRVLRCSYGLPDFMEESQFLDESQFAEVEAINCDQYMGRNFYLLRNQPTNDEQMYFFKEVIRGGRISIAAAEYEEAINHLISDFSR